MRLSLGKVSVRFSRRKPLTVSEHGSSALRSVAFISDDSPSMYHFPLLLMGHSARFSFNTTNKALAKEMGTEVSQRM